MNRNTGYGLYHAKRACGALVLIALIAMPVPADTVPTDARTEARIDALLARMTLDQKLGQLTQQWGGLVQNVNPDAQKREQGELDALVREGKVGSFLGAHGAAYVNRLQKIATEQSKLKIPLIIGNDVIHGYRTIFPIPLAEACSFDLAGIEHAARVAATEARSAGTHWTFAPMVDIARDPRWGRVAEGAGEDPWWGSRVAAARVRGFQGRSLRDADAVAACAKHFAAYGAAEGGRDYNTVDLSMATLRDVYLPPFHAAVQAGAATLMSAFNEINGIPATANTLTLQHILRDEWGFNGFVVSDWGSVQEMVTHGFARDNAHAALLAIQAGVDMDMSSFAYRTHLGQLVRDHQLDESVIDRAVRRILRVKFALGLFDDPYSDPAVESAVTLCDAHRKAARSMAANSIVLLKNDGNLLPIPADTATIAVIGPQADSPIDALGTWAAIGRPEDAVSVLAGIRERLPKKTKLLYAQGCDTRGNRTDGFDNAITTARQSDLVIMVLGEDRQMSGEGHSRAHLNLPGQQLELLKRVYETKTPVVVVLVTGRPLAIEWTADHVPAIVVAWQLGVEMGHAVADVLFGDVNPSGKLAMTFPRFVGQVPIHYDHKNTGRPAKKDERYTSKYIDVPWTPLYPFGYGLSYTTFAYDNLRLDRNKYNTDDTIRITVDITNTGQREGIEVVQLYVRDPVASRTRPVRQLRGVRRVPIAAGKTTTVQFDLSTDDLGFYRDDHHRGVEPGRFMLWVGPDADDGLEGEFEIVP